MSEITDDILAQCEDDHDELIRELAAEVTRLRRKDLIWKAEVLMLRDSAKELGGDMVDCIADLEAEVKRLRKELEDVQYRYDVVDRLYKEYEESFFNALKHTLQFLRVHKSIVK